MDIEKSGDYKVDRVFRKGSELAESLSFILDCANLALETPQLKETMLSAIRMAAKDAIDELWE